MNVHQLPCWLWTKVALMNDQWYELVLAIPTFGRYSLCGDVQQYIRNEVCRRDYENWPLNLSYKYWLRKNENCSETIVRYKCSKSGIKDLNVILRYCNDTRWNIAGYGMGFPHIIEGYSPSDVIRRLFMNSKHESPISKILTRRGNYITKYSRNSAIPTGVLLIENGHIKDNVYLRGAMSSSMAKSFASPKQPDCRF